ncbi:hypothetical protein EK904_011903 [Melospiza melodia maxima]|nr:hypothetical protein EK904_011903 [Melospiza melodia maxima]
MEREVLFLWNTSSEEAMYVSARIFMLTVLLLTTKAGSAALPLARLTAAGGVSPCGSPAQAGTRVFKSSHSARGLGLEQPETGLSSVHCGTGNIIPQLKDFISVSSCAYTFVCHVTKAETQYGQMDTPLTPVTTKEGMCPRDNFGPAWVSRKTAKCSVPNGKKVGTAGYKKLYSLCLMRWKSQKGKRNYGRQNGGCCS